MTVGENIRKYRIEKGLTQKQLGEKCNIAEPTIRRYELNKLHPKIKTLAKIASALNIDVYVLLENTIDDMTTPTKTPISIQSPQNIVNLFSGNTVSANVQLTTHIDLEKDCETVDILLKNIVYENLENELSNFLSIYLPNTEIFSFTNKHDKNSLKVIYDSINKLNEPGKKEAVKRIEELTQIKKYTEPIDTQTENEKEV